MIVYIKERKISRVLILYDLEFLRNEIPIKGRLLRLASFRNKHRQSVVVVVEL